MLKIGIKKKILIGVNKVIKARDYFIISCLYVVITVRKIVIYYLLYYSKVGLLYSNFPSAFIVNITLNVSELSSDKMNSYSPFF